MERAPILTADKPGIVQAADRIRSGGVIVYPTETVYGLGADPFNHHAFDRIFSLKGRETDKGLILLIRGREDLDALVADISLAAESLIREFWPGPLTLVFPAAPGLPEHSDRNRVHHSPPHVRRARRQRIASPCWRPHHQHQRQPIRPTSRSERPASRRRDRPPCRCHP